MATKLKTLTEEIRESIDDFAEDSISAYSMLKKCNRALQRISNRLISKKEFLLTKKYRLSLLNGASDLPSDFQNLLGIRDEPALDSIIPAVPVVSVANGNKQAYLSWTASENATSYLVYRKNIAGGYDLLHETTATNCIALGLLEGEPYTFIVAAVNPYGNSYSDEAGITLAPNIMQG